MLQVLSTAKGARGRSISEVFLELPPKKELPDYYEVIRRPVAFETIRGRLRGHKYPTFLDFLKDVAQIFFNAKLYNMRNSVIYESASTLEELANNEIEKFNQEDICVDEELPSVGDLPPNSVVDEAEVPENASEPEEPKSKKQKLSDSLQKEESKDVAEEEVTQDGETSAKKRNRPPKLETPDECRMKNILKAIRRVKRGDDLIYEPFEKLPPAAEYPDYYEHIKNPMSIALVKKNLKRKVYEAGLEQFAKDIKTIFSNAQFYNETNSSIYKDATYFLTEVDEIVKTEVQKDDKEFQNLEPTERNTQDGAPVKLQRTPVPSVLHQGQTYAIGDWVLLENSNDNKSPIVAQIFKTWQNSDGRYWINACWYYYPFQTVHRADKLWIEHEVVKTGQYRDHAVNEIIEHCYVMYVTRYTRGRPQNLTFGEEKIFVCESRYNEEVKTFNRIKAWKSCVPEESREQCSNYDMSPFPETKHPKRHLSPLMHLMPEDKSLWVNPPEDAKMPEPRERGSINAPPILGNIMVSAVPTELQLKEANGELKEAKKEAGTPARRSTPASLPTLATVQTPAQTSVIGSVSSLPPHAKTVSNPRASGASPYASVSTARTAAPTLSSIQQRQAEPNLPPAPQQLQTLISQGSQIHPTTFVVPLPAGTIPQELGDQLNQDSNGNILWFSVPPIDPVLPHTERGVKGHSIQWLAHQKRKLTGTEVEST